MKTWTPRICSECHHKPSEGSDPLKSDAGGICYCACHRQCDLAPEMAELIKDVVLWDMSKDIGRKRPAPLYPSIVSKARSLLIRLEEAGWKERGQ